MSLPDPPAQRGPAPASPGSATVARHRGGRLFEFEDLPWVPGQLRDPITDWLQQCVVLEYDVYQSTAPLIAELMRRGGTDQVVDLCSGAGGPWPKLKPELEAIAGATSLTLTDKFPNEAAFRRTTDAVGDGRTSYRPDSVDATAVPGDLPGVRTIFTAIHHLRPELVHGLLRDAFDRRVPIGVFDFCGRDQVRSTLRMGIRPMLATMHRLQPRARLNLALTYALPVLPLMILWDATVSNLRAYDTASLDALVADLQAPDWRWETGLVTSRLQPVTYLTGSPITS